MELAVIHLYDLSLEFLLSALLEVEGALVVLGQSVAVAVDEAALTLDAEQSYFLAAVEASLAVLLLLLLGL